MSFDVPKEFGVPDEIGDMTRSLEMAEKGLKGGRTPPWSGPNWTREGGRKEREKERERGAAPLP